MSFLWQFLPRLTVCQHLENVTCVFVCETERVSPLLFEKEKEPQASKRASAVTETNWAFLTIYQDSTTNNLPPRKCPSVTFSFLREPKPQ